VKSKDSSVLSRITRRGGVQIVIQSQFF